MKSGLKVMMVSEGNDFGQTCAEFCALTVAM